MKCLHGEYVKGFCLKCSLHYTDIIGHLNEDRAALLRIIRGALAEASHEGTERYLAEEMERRERNNG